MIKTKCGALVATGVIVIGVPRVVGIIVGIVLLLILLGLIKMIFF